MGLWEHENLCSEEMQLLFTCFHRWAVDAVVEDLKLIGSVGPFDRKYYRLLGSAIRSLNWIFIGPILKVYGK